MKNTTDISLTVAFGLLTILFISLMIFHASFNDWAWERHHNMLSWYIRPVMLVPFMYFAFKRSFAGMSLSIFLLATSMAWFPTPEFVTPDAEAFLRMEREYLSQELNFEYVLLWLTVPAMFILLGIAFWKRSFVFGGFVLVAGVVLKMIWSVVEGGESGWALIPPAGFGLIACLGLVYLGKRFSQK